MQLITKAGLLAAVAALSACSCLKSPDLEVAAATTSQYAESTAQGSEGGLRGTPNMETVKAAFAAGNFSNVYFDYDSASIRDDAAGTLRQFAEFAKANDVKGVTIEGHADERGTREYNLALGDRRAVAVKKYLTGLGLDAGQFTTISYGKERPAVEGHDEASWTKNRRGVLVLN
jgi:peptidoglycan-associated lipoprotein